MALLMAALLSVVPSGTAPYLAISKTAAPGDGSISGEGCAEKADEQNGFHWI